MKSAYWTAFAYFTVWVDDDIYEHHGGKARCHAHNQAITSSSWPATLASSPDKPKASTVGLVGHRATTTWLSSKMHLTTLIHKANTGPLALHPGRAAVEPAAPVLDTKTFSKLSEL